MWESVGSVGVLVVPMTMTIWTDPSIAMEVAMMPFVQNVGIEKSPKPANPASSIRESVESLTLVRFVTSKRVRVGAI